MAKTYGVQRKDSQALVTCSAVQYCRWPNWERKRERIGRRILAHGESRAVYKKRSWRESDKVPKVTLKVS